jgi:hypothetical protein
VTVPSGTVAVPDWLLLDRLLVEAWKAWQDELCPLCGKHLSTHAGKTWRDYANPVKLECPLAEARERHNAEQARKEGRKDVSPDSSRWTLLVHDLRASLRSLAEHTGRLLAPPPKETHE